MANYSSAFVVSHVIYRTGSSHTPLEGPYSSVCKALTELNIPVTFCLTPLGSYEKPILYNSPGKESLFYLPRILTKYTTIKYLFDVAVVFFMVIRFYWNNKDKKKIVIGVDSLSCISLILLKKILNFKLVFYSVDYNSSRFENSFLPVLYQKCDAFASRFSDQVWAVCQSLIDQKKQEYGVNALYIPNSSIFDGRIYETHKELKTGNKVAWTGSLLTEKQFDILFSVAKKIEKIRPDLEFYFVPTSNYEKFRLFSKKYKLKRAMVLELHSRSEWQQFAARCDIGIAIYDDKFESTRFIEPLKIWDFMLCGMPFIISSEPSISNPIKKSGVAYFLKPGNKLPNDKSLSTFLKQTNLKRLQLQCMSLAKEYDIKKQIENALKKL